MEIPTFTLLQMTGKQNTIILIQDKLKSLNTTLNRLFAIWVNFVKTNEVFSLFTIRAFTVSLPINRLQRCDPYPDLICL